MELLQPIIQHILYFLTTREAAVTAALSKSWYSAWRTLPNIDLDEKDYCRGNPGTTGFLELVNKTIQRYEESNFRIQSFSLRIECSVYNQSHIGANKLIVRALKIGAARFTLRLRCGYPDFHFLPNEVFAAENLIGLHARGFRIDLGPDPEVRCWRLESLSLEKIGVKPNVNCIPYIISRCGLIKDLSLSDMYEYEDSNEQDMGLVGYSLDFPKLHNLRCLVLSHVEFKIFCMKDLLSKFPSLKELTLYRSSIVLEQLLVSSRSLELLNIGVEHSITKAMFDVPNIRKFTFEGPVMQSVSWKPTLREWESHLSIMCRQRLSTSWFLELSKMVTQLSQSKLHLSCRVLSSRSVFYQANDLRGLLKPEVENLIMDLDDLPSLCCIILFDGLFQICRPKFLTHHFHPGTSLSWERKHYCPYKMLVKERIEKCSIQSVDMGSLHDLKQVNVQLFDEVVAEWQGIPLKSWLDASIRQMNKQKFRIGLEWRNTTVMDVTAS